MCQNRHEEDQACGGRCGTVPDSSYISIPNYYSLIKIYSLYRQNSHQHCQVQGLGPASVCSCWELQQPTETYFPQYRKAEKTKNSNSWKSWVCRRAAVLWDGVLCSTGTHPLCCVQTKGLGGLPGASGVGEHHKTSCSSPARGWLSNYPGGFLL